MSTIMELPALVSSSKPAGKVEIVPCGGHCPKHQLGPEVKAIAPKCQPLLLSVGGWGESKAGTTSWVPATRDPGYALPHQCTWGSRSLSSGSQDTDQGLEEDPKGLGSQCLWTVDIGHT